MGSQLLEKNKEHSKHFSEQHIRSRKNDAEKSQSGVLWTKNDGQDDDQSLSLSHYIYLKSTF